MAKKDLNNDKKKNNFGKELSAEMKKVTWPTFKQLVTSTSGVISIVLIVAIIVFILDVCFENINKFGVENLKTVVSNNTEQNGEDLGANTSDDTSSDENTNVTTDNDMIVNNSENVVVEPTGTSEENTTTPTEQTSGEEVTQ